MNRDPKRELESFFRDELRLARAEAPSFDDLAAYVEGRLGPEERALLEERLAADPVLRQEADDLRALHAQMARPRDVQTRSLPRRLAVLAAAAGLAAVAVLSWRRPGAEGPRPGEVVTPFQALIPALKDGALVMSADGTVAGPASLDGATRDAIAAAWRGDLPVPRAVESLAPARGHLLGPETAAHFGPIAPVGTRVGEDRPTFRWAPLPEASRYEITVYDSDLRKQLASGPVSSTEWTPTRGLARGRIYLWQVTAVAAGRRLTAPAPPAPEARFEVAAPDVIARVEQRRAQAPGSHLVAAVALIEAGLLDEGERELAALAAAHPASPEVSRLRETLAAVRQGGPEGKR
jgi:hypothetical protein